MVLLIKKDDGSRARPDGFLPLSGVPSRIEEPVVPVKNRAAHTADGRPDGRYII